MSDHIAVMSDGWVEQIGSPTEIYHRPATPFVAGFIGEANLLPGQLQGREGGLATVALAGGSVAVPDVAGATGSVLLMVRPEKVRVDRSGPVGAAAGIPATVQEIIFRGPMVHVGLAAADGSSVVAHITDDRSLGGLRPGDPAWATWERDVAYLVPAHAGHSPAPPDPLEALGALDGDSTGGAP